jgi:hypothetical protein
VNTKARDPTLGLRAEAMNILPDATDPTANDAHSASESDLSIRVRRTPYRLTPDAKAADYHQRLPHATLRADASDRNGNKEGQ